MNILSVQDPLCSFNNTASLLEVQIFKKFYSECVVICKMFQDNDALATSTDSWGLMAILHKPERYEFRSLDIIKPMSFNLPIKSEMIDDGTALQTEALLTAKTVLKALEHVLLFECSHLEGDEIIDMLEGQDKLIAEKRKQLLTTKYLKQEFPTYRKRRSKDTTDIEIESLSSETVVEQFKKASADHKLILCSKCKISKDVMKGRELVKLNLPNSDLLNQEHLISKAVAEENGQHLANEKKKSYVYLFECYFPSNAPEPSILVNLRPLPEKINTDYGYKMQCLRLSIFLKDYIPKIMKNLEL